MALVSTYSILTELSIHNTIVKQLKVFLNVKQTLAQYLV